MGPSHPDGGAHSAPTPSRPLGPLARFGLVLARDADSWRKLELPIRLGLGGPLGSGEQWWSWIDADELARALLFLAGNEEAQGPVNLVSPEPVRQGELVRQAAFLLYRPALLPAPETLLRLALGGEGSFGGHGQVAGGSVHLPDSDQRTLKRFERRLEKNILTALGLEGMTVLSLGAGD